MDLVINWDKQGKHIKGHRNYIEGRSILTADPELLLKRYAGKGRKIIVDNEWPNKERFSHTETIGIWKTKNGEVAKPTKNGIFHYSKRESVHIVPADPND